MRLGPVRTFMIGCVGVTLLLGLVQQAGASSAQPADKVAADGSALAVMTAPLTAGSTSQPATLLSATMRTSAPEDLIFNVTLECALVTDVTNVGNSDSSAVAEVKVWVTLDGKPVPVSSDDTAADAGKVVFCNRAYREVISNMQDQQATFDHYLSTRSANAFNWLTLDVGPGIHQLTVEAQLEAEVTGTGTAQALVGKRTLIVDPTKLANDAVI